MAFCVWEVLQSINNILGGCTKHSNATYWVVVQSISNILVAETPTVRAPGVKVLSGTHLRTLVHYIHPIVSNHNHRVSTICIQHNLLNIL